MKSSKDIDTQSALRVFIVCDQADTAPILGYMIRERGLTAIIETSVQRALDNAMSIVPDMIIIDVNAPHPERIKLCKKYRSLSDSPILLFIPSHHETEILDAYRAGVDECIVKPISPAIFLAKITAWSRYSGRTAGEKLTIGKLQLDSAHRIVTLPNNEELGLTNLEFRLLQLLVSRPGHVFLNEEIMRAVWGISGDGDQTPLKNVVYRLRKKIGEGEGYVIQTSPGGYSFRED